jgi:hypothetical protein
MLAAGKYSLRMAVSTWNLIVRASAAAGKQLSKIDNVVSSDKEVV